MNFAWVTIVGLCSWHVLGWAGKDQRSNPASSANLPYKPRQDASQSVPLPLLFVSLVHLDCKFFILCLCSSPGSMVLRKRSNNKAVSHAQGRRYTSSDRINCLYLCRPPLSHTHQCNSIGSNLDARHKWGRRAKPQPITSASPSPQIHHCYYLYYLYGTILQTMTCRNKIPYRNTWSPCQLDGTTRCGSTNPEAVCGVAQGCDAHTLCGIGELRWANRWWGEKELGQWPRGSEKTEWWCRNSL